jgi:hypothetical protein
MFARFPNLNILLAWRNVGSKKVLIATLHVNRDLVVFKSDSDGGLYNHFITDTVPVTVTGSRALFIYYSRSREVDIADHVAVRCGSGNGRAASHKSVPVSCNRWQPEFDKVCKYT